MADIPLGSTSVESFRVDVSFRAWPLLALAATLTTIGAAAVCTAFVSRGMFMHEEIVTHAGTLCMLTGPLVAVVAMRRLLQADEYVAALDTGLLVHCANVDAFVAWSDVARVSWDESAQAVIVARREGEAIAIAQTFGRARAEDVATKLDDVRRKATFGIS